MLLDHLGHRPAAARITRAARTVLPKSVDGALKTVEIGDLVADAIAADRG